MDHRRHGVGIAALRYEAFWPCHRELTPRYRQRVAAAAASKQVHHLTSSRAVASFIADVTREYADRH